MAIYPQVVGSGLYRLTKVLHKLLLWDCDLNQVADWDANHQHALPAWILFKWAFATASLI